MPTFQVQSGDKTFEIDAPDQNSALKAFMNYAPSEVQSTEQQPQEPSQPEQQASQPQHTPWSEIANDTANSIISGGIGGMVGLAGLPGDVVKGVGGLTGFYNPDKIPIPGSETIGNAVKGTIGDYSYTPTTGAGEIAGTIAGFAGGGAGLGAGGSLLRQGGQVLGTALGSKAAGDIGRMISPEAGTVGDITGALLAGHQLSKGSLPQAPRPNSADVLASEASQVTSPATEAVKRISTEAYNAADAAGVAIKGDRFYGFLRNLENDSQVKKLFLNPGLHKNLEATTKEIIDSVPGPQAAGAMATITGVKPQWNPGAVTLEQFDNFRRNVLRSTRSADADERRIAGHILNRMDAYFNNMKPGVDATGDVMAAQQAINTARQNWRIYRKSEDIDKIMKVAEERAGQFSVSGNENAIRTGFRQLAVRIAKDKRVANQYTKDEISLIRQLSRGWHTRDALKNIGAILNNRFVQGGALLGGGYMSLESGDPDAILYGIAASLIGHGARSASGALTKRRAAELSQLVRGGGKITGGTPNLPLSAGIAAINNQQ